MQDERDHPMSMSAGPLPDPRWDAYFQAVSEAAGGRPVTYAGSAGPDLGVDTNDGSMGAGFESYGRRLRTFSPSAETSLPLKGLQAATHHGDPIDRALYYPNADTGGAVDKQTLELRKARGY